MDAPVALKYPHASSGAQDQAIRGEIAEYVVLVRAQVVELKSIPADPVVELPAQGKPEVVTEFAAELHAGPEGTAPAPEPRLYAPQLPTPTPPGIPPQPPPDPPVIV